MKVLDGMKYIGMASRFIRIKMVVFCGNKKRRREQKRERERERERNKQQRQRKWYYYEQEQRRIWQDEKGGREDINSHTYIE